MISAQLRNGAIAWIGIAVITCAGVAICAPCRAKDLVISVEEAEHHLGDDPGAEGASFRKSFKLRRAMADARLHIDFIETAGPNLEAPPRILINGKTIGSLAVFYPAVDESDPAWQTNSDGSHDFNGGMHIEFPVRGLLRAGKNTFEIKNGRDADDYFFARVKIREVRPPSPAYGSDSAAGGSVSRD